MMGINTPTNLVADLQVGPTDKGMVRIYVTGDSVDLPMDFTPAEALEIAAELAEAANQAGSGRRRRKIRRPGKQ
jgi:hypothetical protein